MAEAAEAACQSALETGFSMGAVVVAGSLGPAAGEGCASEGDGAARVAGFSSAGVSVGVGVAEADVAATVAGSS